MPLFFPSNGASAVVSVTSSLLAAIANNGTSSFGAYLEGTSGNTNHFASVDPVESASAPYTWAHTTYDNPVGTRKNQVFAQGYNVNQRVAGEASFQVTLESDYDAGLGPVMEFYYAVCANSGGETSTRPWTLDVDRTTGVTTIVERPAQLAFQRYPSGSALWAWNLSEGGPAGHCAISMSTTPINYETNNVAIMKQKGAGAYSLELMKANASDQIYIGQDNVDTVVGRSLAVGDRAIGHDFKGGTRVVYIQDGTAPTSNPVNGVFLWSDSGTLKCRGPSGSITVLAPP